MKKRRIMILILAVIAVIAVIVLTRALRHNGTNAEGLEMPSQEYVRENGYPVNERGETYGPEVDDLPSPDLSLAIGKDGVMGYLREAEINYTPSTTEEAGLISESDDPVQYNLYLQDGVTVIGIFETTPIAVDMSGISDTN